MNDIPIDEATRAKAASLFAALAHPTRLRITDELCRKPMTVGEVALEMKIGASGASQHLAQLARAGVLVAESHGTSRVYRVRGPRIASVLTLIFEFCQVHELPMPGGISEEDLSG